MACSVRALGAESHQLSVTGLCHDASVTILIVAILIVALVVAVIVIVRLVNGRTDLVNRQTELLRYRDSHPYGPDQLLMARRDAVKRSHSTVSGNVWEGMAPYLPEFPYNPQDCHHLGKPVDLLAFDGLSEGGEVTVRLIEVKTAKSRLNANERRVKAAVVAGRVTYEVLRLAGSPALDEPADAPIPSGRIVELERQPWWPANWISMSEEQVG